MKYEIEAAEAIEEQEIQQNLELNPPKLENTRKKEEMPPKMERQKDRIAEQQTSLGGSRDAFNKRKALESSTNKIQAEHRARDYAEQLKEDERKKQEYREKLYGK